MGDGLSIVDIGNFCLLTEKYKTLNEESGVNNNNNSENSKFFLEKCSESLSIQLKTMDYCQKLLYGYGYKKEYVEQIKEARDIFKDYVETMQEVLKAFSMILEE